MTTFMNFLSSPLSPTINHSVPYILTNWTLSYLILAPRHWKQYYGFDHNESPRYDIEQYGERMVLEGKLTRRQLDRVKRVQSAQSNSIEHFGVFVGCILLAQQAGLPVQIINKFGFYYNLARIGYGFAYTFLETRNLSVLRSAFWWWGNVSCIGILLEAGWALNEGV
ncbi:hypothetical protein SS1G_08893 [Sclerotinia sclerotiorum 1980 UF-70]|uniref:Uncharacterized protein n=2 Tax=Sclerotinia sclerotiorum (strain ATCC 18683 / 1980 / Ss-1) TaxID=665079 RepID=A7EU86_SCLS1|nr:hypothetical protein SS1G_08893 [Sclerotinia sclerotiorum 1980 UF-70]APA15262.1 hypothetical protein sscle_14g100320 [Sclerotinia sclerotiorum 1980 UF-70]EDN93028.1 hypothetical protein SS1G_08893 [Sclerotinia sclerotiorum 1980 UF-70]